MKHRILLACAAVSAVTSIAAFSPSPADAAIKCRGNFQIIRGSGEIYTPYCADNYLAAVAQQSGMRVSAAAIRNNPSIKASACRLVGYDIRVKDTCQNYLPDGRRRG